MNIELFDFEKVILSNESQGFQKDTISHITGKDRIISEFSRIPINTIVNLYEDGYFKLTPEYQRHLKWSDSQKSKLIESLILNIPIPPVFLYEYSLSKTEVMDGIQRISAIVDFLSNKYTLKDLVFLSDLNGKSFSDLNEDSKNSIKRRHLSSIIILNESSNNEIKEKQIKRIIFERLNTGGVLLTSQEVRHAIYPGNFLDRCLVMAKNQFFIDLWGIENDSKKTKDRKYEELVIRFFALRAMSNLNIESKTIEGMLDKYLYFSNKLNNTQIEQLTSLFDETVKLIFNVLGVEAFKKNGKGVRVLSLSDPIMLVFSNHVSDKDKLIQHSADISKCFKEIDYNDKDNQTLFNGKYWSNKILMRRCGFFDDIVSNACK